MELIIFAFTILALAHILPDLKPFRILSGLLKMHTLSMIMIMCCVWMANLLFQSTYSGMDPLFKFEWVDCEDKANTTWVGGYRWEC